MHDCVKSGLAQTEPAGPPELPLIHNLFGTANSPKLQITMSHCQKQLGEKDCGFFSIAYATALAFGLQPSKQKFNQPYMRKHLVNRFNQKQISPFPC